MYFTPQIDSLKAYIHSLCGLLRNSSLSFSLSLCALLPFIAKVDNLIRNIIVESGKKKFLALCWFLIYFIHQPQASNFCSCTQTGKQTRVFFSFFFSINLAAILKWIILNLSNSPSSYHCDFELGYCGLDRYQSRITPPSPPLQLQQRAEHRRAIFYHCIYRCAAL